MSYFVSSDDSHSFSLCENSEVASILQNIALLIGTRRGTVPMYREYGMPMEFLDKPLNAAQTLAAREVIEAVEQFEPRAKVKNVAVATRETGKLTIEVEVDIIEQE